MPELPEVPILGCDRDSRPRVLTAGLNINYYLHMLIPATRATIRDDNNPGLSIFYARYVNR